jgi:hypothetical protein
MCACSVADPPHLYALKWPPSLFHFRRLPKRSSQAGRFVFETVACKASIVVAIFCDGDQVCMRAEAACRKDASLVGLESTPSSPCATSPSGCANGSEGCLPTAVACDILLC